MLQSLSDVRLVGALSRRGEKHSCISDRALLITSSDPSKGEREHGVTSCVSAHPVTLQGDLDASRGAVVVHELHQGRFTRSVAFDSGVQSLRSTNDNLLSYSLFVGSEPALSRENFYSSSFGGEEDTSESRVIPADSDKETGQIGVSVVDSVERVESVKRKRDSETSSAALQVSAHDVMHKRFNFG
jgi:hypothetical protein